MDKLALLLISIYQQYLSPYKGYRCAYAVLHDKQSCSHAIKVIIHHKGLITGFSDIRQQFNQCSLAYQQIENNKDIEDDNDSDNRNHKHKSDRKPDNTRIDDCAEPILNIGYDACDHCHLPELNCDCSPCDCGSF